MELGYYDGKTAPLDEITLPLSDRTHFFGDAVYDALVGCRGGLLWKEEHLARLARSAEKVGITLPGGICAVRAAADEMCRGVEEDFFLYIQIARGGEKRKHAYADGVPSHLLITRTALDLPDEERPLSLITLPDLRYEMCDVKTVNLLPNVLAAKRAEEAGADEAVFVRGGIVTECAHSNVSVLKRGILFTHPEGPHILPGIVRRKLLEAAGNVGIPVKEVPFSRAFLANADEILVTSTTRFVGRAGTLDGAAVGGGDEAGFRALSHAVRAPFLSLSSKS